jgi:hypothetical protein
MNQNWKEVQRSKQNGAQMPTVIDGVHGENEICDHFQHKYSELYNSVDFDAAEMQELESRIDVLCRESCSNSCYCDHHIRVEDVAKAIGRLKRGKSDGNPTLMSDHVINGCRALFVHLARLFTMMLTHSLVPAKMLHSVLVPIPKNQKKSLSDSSNYRSIAISSVLGKVLDNIVIEKHSPVIACSNLQFGFRAHHSTTQCTFVLREIIEYYSSHGSPVYVILLDASKAFDRVHYVRLFSLLLQRGLCAATARLLLRSYVLQSMSVRWCNSVSTKFPCSNGVKQGGVLSPVLFTVYMDELLDRLSKLGIGCHLSGSFAGALCYADDLTIITPSFGAANSLLIECEKFADEYDVLFNASKSHALIFNQAIVPIQAKLSLNGSPIEYADRALHLGTNIGADDTMVNIRNYQSDLYGRVNSIHSKFQHCSFDVLRKC